MATIPKTALTIVEYHLAIVEGVEQAWAADGYLLESGAHDKDAVAAKVLELVLETRAETKKERETNAAPREILAALTFPSTPAPGSTEWEEDEDGVNRKVWEKLVGTVNNLTKTGRKGPVQKELWKLDGEALCLCEIGIAGKKTAVYVTASKALIEEDFALARTNKVRHKNDDITADFVALANHRPELRKMLVDKGTRSLDVAKATMKAELAAGASEGGE